MKLSHQARKLKTEPKPDNKAGECGSILKKMTFWAYSKDSTMTCRVHCKTAV